MMAMTLGEANLEIERIARKLKKGIIARKSIDYYKEHYCRRVNGFKGVKCDSLGPATTWMEQGELEYNS